MKTLATKTIQCSNLVWESEPTSCSRTPLTAASSGNGSTVSKPQPRITHYHCNLTNYDIFRWMDGWLGFNSMQVAAISRHLSFLSKHSTSLLMTST